MKLALPLHLLLIIAFFPAVVGAQTITPAIPANVRAPAREKDEVDKFFESMPVLKLKVEIQPDQMQKLRENPRAYARGTIIEEGGATLKSVGIKLKGAAGSFRGVDDRPAFTINTDKYTKKQQFHGLEKFHLNNSVQDPSYLHEMISSELFRAAGVPATRVAHARIWINGRDMGMYVLKEGFDKNFIKRYFAKANGNFYDGGFCQDIDAALEKDGGDGLDDRSDLKAIIEACRDGDEKRRFERFEKVVDIDAMMTFVALELMTCHWDGYCRNVNNYRVYIEPTTNKAFFFPHGMDQMFGDTNTQVGDASRGMVSNTLLQNKLWRAKYYERVMELRPLFAPEKWNARLDEIQKRLEGPLKEIHPDQARDHANRVHDMKQRFVNRDNSFREQFSRFPLIFDKQGVALLNDWVQGNSSGDVKLEEVQLGGRKAYSIQVGPSGNGNASWRRKVLLLKGNYRLEVNAATRGVVGIPNDPKGTAAGVRLGGGSRTEMMDGTSGGKKLSFDFVVNEEQREVELVAELKATAGQVWFAQDGMLLRRLDK